MDIHYIPLITQEHLSKLSSQYIFSVASFKKWTFKNIMKFKVPKAPFKITNKIMGNRLLKKYHCLQIIHKTIHWLLVYYLEQFALNYNNFKMKHFINLFNLTNAPLAITVIIREPSLNFVINKKGLESLQSSI